MIEIDVDEIEDAESLVFLIIQFIVNLQAFKNMLLLKTMQQWLGLCQNE
jgi:hypothetical protein